MKRALVVLIVAVTLISCNQTEIVSDSQTTAFSLNTQLAIDTLIQRYGKENEIRITKGVGQVANLWTETDGTEAEFIAFCADNFANSDNEIDYLHQRLAHNMEVLNGNFNKISIELKRPLHEDKGELSGIDYIFGGFSPFAHIEEDLFSNKTAFIVALNFPFYSLQEKMENAGKWTRKDWARARLGDMFISRMPSVLNQEYSAISTNADTYISEYNIYMGFLRDNENSVLFPEDMKLISHWGLRDELKSNYNTEDGIKKQRLIYEVMKDIISQEIPEQVVNSNEYLWNPYTNQLTKEGNEVKYAPEPNTRYQHMLNIFKSLSAMDEYNPYYPTYIQRKFDKDMELSQKEVEELFVALVSSEQVKKVAELIKKRLGRGLEPFDIWYNGFTPRNSVSEDDMNVITRTRYPDTKAFDDAIPGLLVQLGFDAKNAERIGNKIDVDAARGAGHAWGAEMKDDVSHLRTRIPQTGMDYKGYNIAIHELGHNVEQTLTLQDIDYYELRGVPNTAFTEAIAFMFQKRDLDLLGVKTNAGDKDHLMALDIFWSCYEIMGVSLVDMKAWQWLYENPDATPEQLKDAVVAISKEVWNLYYADVFGIKDQTILAIYSHMIDAPLYLSAYPIGHLIDFQLEKQFKGKEFAAELSKSLLQGRITPQEWMKGAVGMELSVKPLLESTDAALEVVVE